MLGEFEKLEAGRMEIETAVSTAQSAESVQDTPLKTPPLAPGGYSTSCRIPYGKTPWGGTPRSAAVTPYSGHRLPVKSPKVAEVLREADAARFEARYHLKVFELRKANETIKTLKAEAAPVQVLKEMLSQRDAELAALSKELKEANQRTEEVQKKHDVLKEKLSSLTSEHAAALELAVEKERLLLKEQQAASNQRIKEQSLSLHTMTDIMDMTRKGLALAKMMRRVHSTGSSPDVSTLKQSLLQRSGFAAGTEGTVVEERAGVLDEPSKPSIAEEEDGKVGLEGEASFITIASSSDVLELATVHSSPLFRSSSAMGQDRLRDSLPEASHEVEEGDGSTVSGGSELDVELSFRGDVLLKGQAESQETSEGASPKFAVGDHHGGHEDGTQLLPEVSRSAEAASKDEGKSKEEEIDQPIPAEVSPSALQTISDWTAQSPRLVMSAKKQESTEESKEQSVRSPLAAIQNLRSPFRSARRVSERRHVPSPDVENQSPPSCSNLSSAPVFSSQCLPSPQYSPKRSLLYETSPSLPLKKLAPINTSRLSGSPLFTSRFGEKGSPLLKSSRLGLPFQSEESRSPLKSASKPETDIPPIARRLLTNTSTKRSLEDQLLNTPASPALEPNLPAVSPYMGWPMPALVAASEAVEKISLATPSELEQLSMSCKRSPKPSPGTQAKEQPTPKTGYCLSESLGGSPFFADLTTPLRSRSSPASSNTFSAATTDPLPTDFGWGLKKHDSPLPKLPDLALPSRPLLEDPGPPARKRGAMLDVFGQCFRELPKRAPTFVSAGTSGADGLERIEGFAGAEGDDEAEAREEVQPNAWSERATQQGSAEGVRSPKEGLGQRRIAFFEQGALQSAETRKSKKQGRLSRELGGTLGTKELDREKSRAQSRSVNLKDITAPARRSAQRTPDIVQLAPASPPSVSLESTPQADTCPPSADVRARTGLCSVLIVLEEGKSKGKTPNPVIGCIDAPKATTLAELRARIQTELEQKGPERFAFLQAGIGATWHPFSGDVESLVTVLTLPVADGQYRQYTGDTANTSSPVDSPSPSPTRHAVRLAILRPLPLKRALYPLSAAEESAGTGNSVADKRKESAKGSLPAGARKGEDAPLSTKTRSARLKGSAEGSGPWATRPAPSLARISAAGLSVRMSGSLRESAVADVARKMRARDK